MLRFMGRGLFDGGRIGEGAAGAAKTAAIARIANTDTFGVPTLVTAGWGR